MKFENQVGKLSHPKEFNSPIDLKGISEELRLNFAKKMILARNVEKFLAAKRKDGLIGGPVHLSAGQEAIAVGVSENLTKSDRVFSAHRSHAHLMALNPDYKKLFAEVLGKNTGFSKGMGGSMHLWDENSGFYGAVPIVAGTVPLAVGAGLAAKLQNKKDVGVVYFGDGAMEEGVVHESLNLAKVLEVPVLFVVENNFFSSHMHISLRQPSNLMTRFATANHIENELADGNDIVDVYKKSKRLIESSRNGNGPGFLEVITYRHFGHVDWREDIDVGVNRSLEDVDDWRLRDPIKRLTDSMKEESEIINSLNDIEVKLDKKFIEAWQEAETDEYPPLTSLLDRVYKK